MKFEKEPTEDNIVETINDDILKRSAVLNSFIKLLYLTEDYNTLALNGDWGAGKTFFVKQAVKIIEELGKEETERDPRLKEYVNQLEIGELKEITNKGMLYPIYYNAWEYDSNEDPLLTLIYSIISNNKEISIENNDDIQKKIKKLFSNFKFRAAIPVPIGMTLETEYQYEEKEEITKDVYSIEQAKKTFEELLKKLKIEEANKTVIFVDELDRCNPAFAIKLLERIKHFFNNKEFIFVFSTNISELQHTVKKFYGESMDGYAYLDKFFDLQFNLRNINTEDYINSLNVVNTRNSRYVDGIVKEMCLLFGFSLRRINRYIELIKLQYNYITTQDIYDFALSRQILFPILLAIKINDLNTYEKIISGDGEEELKGILLKNSIIIEYLNDFFRVDNSLLEFKFDFHEMYRCIFTNNDERGLFEIEIGNNYAQERKRLMEMLTGLNEFIEI